MSAENIAKVIADIRAGRTAVPDVSLKPPFNEERSDAEIERALEVLRVHDIDIARTAVVIDAQRFYEQVTSKDQRPYDHNLMPVWEAALVAYENVHGNVNVACIVVHLKEHTDSWETENPVDWARVKYVYYVDAYMGGRGNGRPIQTQGPLYLWRIAVYDDGEIADIFWQNVLAFDDPDMFVNLMLVVLKSYDLGNCVNVELAVPHAATPQQRRLDRHGVKVSEIHVRSISKTYQGKGGQPLSPGVPLASVRGHHVHYGPKYGRKLLFGKYEGRFGCRNTSEVLPITESASRST